MVLNFPGPYEVRIFYTTSGLTHQLRLSVELIGAPTIGTDFADIDVNPRVSAAYPLSTWVDGLIAVIKTRFGPTGSTFDYAELWEYTLGTNDAQYISAYTIGVPGTGGAEAVPAAYEMYTFRTDEGGTMRLTLMEVGIDLDTQTPYAAMATGSKNIADYITSPDSPVVGRDTGRVVMCIKNSFGENEAIWRKRNRS